MTREDLIKWVQARLDEFAPIDQIGVFPPAQIGRELDAAANDIIKIAPISKLYTMTKDYSEQFCLLGKNSVIIPVSDDILRYVRIKLNNWDNAIHYVYDVESVNYKMQKYQYLSATTQFPFAAIAPFIIGSKYHKAIECFPTINDYSDYRTIPDNEEEEELKSEAEKKGYTIIFNKNSDKSLINELIMIPMITAEMMEDELLESLVLGAVARILYSVKELQLANNVYQLYILSLGLNVESKKNG